MWLVNLGEVMISDEMVKIALQAFHANVYGILGMKAALEAVFDHIADADKMVSDKAAGLEAELDIVIRLILRAYDLDALKGVILNNYPKYISYDTQKYLENDKEICMVSCWKSI